MHFFGARIRPVDLVDHHDRHESQLERLAGDKTSLRHGALGGIHQDQDTVHHAQDALDLTAKVRVTRRVHDVDLRVAPPDRGVLGQNRDAPLALERIRVHHALLHLLVVLKHTRLAQHLVDQRRLAVIDVRDDRDISKPQFDNLPESSRRTSRGETRRVRNWYASCSRVAALGDAVRVLSLRSLQAPFALEPMPPGLAVLANPPASPPGTRAGRQSPRSASTWAFQRRVRPASPPGPARARRTTARVGAPRRT